MATVGCPRDPASRDGTGYGKDKDFRNRTDRENYLGRIDGHDIRTVQELLGNKDMDRTMFSPMFSIEEPRRTEPGGPVMMDSIRWIAR